MPALHAIISGDSKPFANEMAKVEHIVGHTISHIGSSVAGLVSIGALEHVVHSTVEYGEKVADLAKRLGISTDAVQEWDFALRQNGTTLEENAAFFERLATNRKKAMEGNEEIIKSFKNLGVTIDDLKSKRLEEIALQIAEVFRTGDSQKLIADLREVGGRGAGELVAAFKVGIEELIKESHNAGIIIEKDVIAKLKEVGDNFKIIGQQITAIAAGPIASFSDVLAKSAKGWRIIFETIKGFGTGGGAGAYVAFRRIRDEIFSKHKPSGSSPGIGGADEDTSKADRKEYDKLARLQERLQELKDRNFLKTLDKEGRLSELQSRKKAADEIANSPWLSSEKILKAQIESEKLSGEIRDEMNSGKNKTSHGSLTSLQQIGAFSLPGQVSLLDVNKKMEGHLLQIKNVITRNQKIGATTF